MGDAGIFATEVGELLSAVFLGISGVGRICESNQPPLALPLRERDFQPKPKQRAKLEKKVHTVATHGPTGAIAGERTSHLIWGLCALFSALLGC